MEITEHAAIVTSGGSGMRAETARHLAAAGVKVALLDVNMTGTNAVAEKIGGVAIYCDVAEERETRLGRPFLS